MPISLISSPADYAPAYNPMQYVFDSDNKQLAGYRYIVDLRRDDDNTLIKRMRIRPRIGDGFGVADVGKALQTYLTHERIDTVNADATNCYIKYRLELGEEYSGSWPFDRWERSSNITDGIWNNKIALSASTSEIAHPFVAGDVIKVFLDDINADSYNFVVGLATVGFVEDQFTIVLTKNAWVPEPSQDWSGSVSFADNRAVIQNFKLLEVTNKWAYNAAWPVQQFPNYSDSNVDLIFTDPDKDLLTNMPKTFRVTRNTRIVLNVPIASSALTPAKIYFVNGNGVERTTFLNNQGMINAIGVGPANLPSATWSGGSATFLNNTNTYRFTITDIQDQQISNGYFFEIDDICSRYPVNEIMFLDRKGSMGSFYFPYFSQMTTNIERQNATFINGQWVAVGNLGLYDGGKKALSVDLAANFELTTAWLTADESLYFQELLTSPVAFLRLGDGSIKSVILTERQAEERLGFDQNNIRYTINVEYSNNNIINW